ncbi:MAG: hypothetical protein KKD44_29585 [Proteobacteria bacterium]|nr:hypothetical protein [Pseudomonadota bacterium]
MIIFLIIIVLGGAFALAIFIINRQKWAMKQARKMLEAKSVDAKVLKKVVKMLGVTNNNEARELLRRLMDLEG